MAKPRILFITAYVPNKAAAGEKNTMIMLNDLAQDYDVDLVYFKYDHEAPYVPERDNVKVLEVLHNSTKTKLFGIVNYPCHIRCFLSVSAGRNCVVCAVSSVARTTAR